MFLCEPSIKQKINLNIVPVFPTFMYALSCPPSMRKKIDMKVVPKKM